MRDLAVVSPACPELEAEIMPAMPRLCCGAVVLDERGQVLLAKRKQEPEAEHWGLPEGIVNRMEPLEMAITKRLHAALGILVFPHRILAVSDMICPEHDHHLVSIVYAARLLSGEPRIREPDLISDLGWFQTTRLPGPLTQSAMIAFR